MKWFQQKIFSEKSPKERNVHSTVDDYAKDGGPEVVWLLCSFYHEPLRSLTVKKVQ